ncbi:hypothetical protein [Clostridium botulinum]|uniref:HNH endonuclease n=1 Tax=Clostridium botulinum TaxID=1491 RepID=A0ABD7CFS2_CLOBO|nr:hypothetical protein [Clostridium botulinum]MCC5427514.1 hypothetical protein [Clostridium botulinum]QRI51901.1 hypothetical protein JQS73_10530 [Clostridium botulinum]
MKNQHGAKNLFRCILPGCHKYHGAHVQHKINEYIDDLGKNDFIEDSEDIKLNKGN